MKGNVQRSFWRLVRQRMKAFAFCLGVTGFTNPPIREALAPDAFEGLGGALVVLDLAGVVAEIEFADVTL